MGSLEGAAIIFDPLDALALVPDTPSLFALRRNEDALAMLLAVCPLALIGSAIRVRIDPITVLLVVEVVAFVLAAVCPFVNTLAMHVVVKPVALVGSLVIPGVLAVATDLILKPVAFVDTSVTPLVNSIPIFHAVLVVPDVFGPVDPLFFSMTFLDIVFELSLIFGAIDVGVISVAISHVVFELTPVDISFSMPEGALAFCLIERPLAFIVCSVSPVLNSIAVPDDGRSIALALNLSIDTFVGLLLSIIGHVLVARWPLNVLDAITFSTQSVLKSSTLETVGTAGGFSTALHPESHGFIDLLHLAPIN